MKSCQSLGNNRITDQNNSASAANLNFPAEPQGKKNHGQFSIYFGTFPFCYCQPILIPEETKKIRPRISCD